MKIRLAVLLVFLSSAAVVRADDLTARVEALAKKYEATIGVAAIDTMTGRKVSINSGERFPMGSVYKLPIAMTVLRKASLGQLSLDEQVSIEPKDFSPGHSPIAEQYGKEPAEMPLGSVVLYALRDSDNTASDYLLRRAGGPQGVLSYLNFLGVRGIDISRSEKQIDKDIKKKGLAAYWKDPRDSTTPDMMVLLLRMFDERAHGLNAGEQQFVRDLLEHGTTGANRIRAGIPAEAKVFHKSGTMPGVVNDVAIAISRDERHRVIFAIFSKGWRKTSDDDRDKVIADIAREIYGEFAKF